MICIASWNIQNGKGVDGVLSLERIASVIRQMGDPDVICLQEVSRHLPLGDGGQAPDQVGELSELFAGYLPVFGVAVEGPVEDSSRRWQFGNITLCRLPVLSMFHHMLPRPPEPGIRHMARQAIEVTVAGAAGPLRVMNTHLEFHSQVQRQAQVERLRSTHQEVVANLEAPPLHDVDGPYRQVQRAGDCLICGDFNMETGSPEYTAMQAPLADNGPGFQDAWRTIHPDDPHRPTCGIFDQTQWPQGPHCRDYFFTSGRISGAIDEIWVDEVTAASDHQPLMISFAL